MAGTQVYHALKQYGTKIGKFKQDVLLPAANAMVIDGVNLLSDEELQTVRSGACLTITTTWLRTIMTAKPFAYDNVPNAQNADLVRSAATAAKVHGHLKAQAASSTAHQTRLYLASRLNVPLSEYRCVTGTTFKRAMSAVAALPVGQGALVSSMVHRRSTGAYIGKHATGFHLCRQGFMRFFDPNVGEYEIALQRAPTFFEAYRSILSASLDQDFRSSDLYMATLS